MFDNKSKVTQYAGYILIGFFLLIIILSFGMPDLGLNCGNDPSTLVNINGQKIHPIEFNKYRRLMYLRYGSESNEQLDTYFLQSFITEVLFQQRAEKEGITFSEDRLSALIKNSPDFKNPDTGKYDPLRLQFFLNSSYMSLNEFEKMFRRLQSQNEIYYYITRAGAVPSEEIKFKNSVNGTRIQIKYAQLTNDDIRQRYSKELTVTDDEITNEINSKNTKISDPNTDRARIRKELEDKKLDKIKNDIIEKINSIASTGGSFDSCSSILQGRVLKSAPFKVGEDVKSEEKEGKVIASINSSDIFIDRILVMNLNSASPVINSASGLYIFTPVLRELPVPAADIKTEEKTREELASAGINNIIRNFITDLRQNSKIIKNIKTD